VQAGYIVLNALHEVFTTDVPIFWVEYPGTHHKTTPMPFNAGRNESKPSDSSGRDIQLLGSLSGKNRPVLHHQLFKR